MGHIWSVGLCENIQTRPWHQITCEILCKGQSGVCFHLINNSVSWTASFEKMKQVTCLRSSCCRFDDNSCLWHLDRNIYMKVITKTLWCHREYSQGSQSSSSICHNHTYIVKKKLKGDGWVDIFAPVADPEEFFTFCSTIMSKKERTL